MCWCAWLEELVLGGMKSREDVQMQPEAEKYCLTMCRTALFIEAIHP